MYSLLFEYNKINPFYKATTARPGSGSMTLYIFINLITPIHGAYFYGFFNDLIDVLKGKSGIIFKKSSQLFTTILMQTN